MKKITIFVLAVFLIISASSLAFAETEVRISGFGGLDQNIVEELIANFVKPELEDEEISVTYEPIADNYQSVLLNSLSAGTAADLFYMDIFWAQNVISKGLVEPLDSYLKESDMLAKDDIIDSLVEGFTYEGKLYGIPKDFNSLALFYNKDLFDVAGVEYPNKDDTWKTLEEKLTKVTAADDDFVGMALQPEFARMGAFTYANKWEKFDAEGNTNLLDEKFKDAFAWYTGLKEKGLGIMPADMGKGWGGGALANGNVATCIEGAWILGFLRDQAPNLQYGATLLPKSPSTNERGNFIFTVAWGINKESKNKDEAFRVLELLTSKKAQQWVLERGLAIPSRKSLANNPYFEKDSAEAKANKVVFEGASVGNVKPFSFGDYGGAWMEPINTALNEVMSGQATVEEALKQAQKRLDQDIMK
ncbi:MAG: ABC transporter substrate-binding protein [Halanaerobiales bacterium]|nr:ABC transporter substrate-binding protein [Halanaerobiales bacterium]